MAPMPRFSAPAFTVRCLIGEGRERDAIKYAAQQLRSRGDEFLSVVADLIDPKKKKRGGQEKNEPPYWLEIGGRYEELKEVRPKLPADEIRSRLTKQFGPKDRSIREAIRVYLAAKRVEGSIE